MTYQFSSVEFPYDIRGHLIVERPKGSGTYVRLNDDAKKCVVYFVKPNVKSGEFKDERPGGTGFLVEYGNPPAVYLVTAAHVARNLKNCEFGVRLNRTENGEAKINVIPEGAWVDHPDELVDVSAMPYEIPEWADATPYRKYFVTEEKRETKDFGAGDLVYVVGVYRYLYGKKRNLPAVHVGHIASMADGEDIPTRDWRAVNPEKADPIMVRGHLIQAPTAPAASGSPVFVRRSLFAPIFSFDQEGNKANLNGWKYGSVWLLGLWHGAWGNKSKFVQTADGDADLGMDMGVVIPAFKIVELLERPELVEKRKSDARKKTDPDSIVRHQSDFDSSGGDDILRAALNTPPRTKPKRKTTARHSGVSKK